MAVDFANLQIQIDSSGIKKAGLYLDDLSKKGKKVGEALNRYVTLPLTAGFGAAIWEAAKLEGQLDKFDVVFQGMNAEMMDFVEAYTDEFPVARREVIETSAALQDLLVPMGINRGIAADMTQEWLELAGALSAFNDVPVTRVLDAIRSGMAGQSEALRRYGIDARAAVLESIALAEGLIQSGDAMTEQVRQQALLIQATNQSADAVGGLAEQKGSLQWIIQDLKADMTDYAGVIGTDLIPEVKELATDGGEVVEMFLEMDEASRKLTIRLGLLSAALGPLLLVNKYLAVAGGLGLIATKAALADRELSEMGETIKDSLSDPNLGLSEVNRQIAEIQTAIDEWFTIGGQRVFLTGAQRDEFNQLEEQLGFLITLRDQLAAQQLDSIISEKAIQEVEQFIETSLFLLNEWTFPKEMDRAAQSIERVRIAAEKPIANIFDPVEAARIREIRREADEFNNVLDNILMQDYDFSHRLSMDEFNDDLREGVDWGRELGFTLEQTFLTALDGSRSFLDILDQIFMSMLRLTTQQFVTNPLQDALNETNFFKDLFGKRAMGGPVLQGESYLVGEKGPEIFSPNRSGTIIPNHQISSGAGHSTNVYVRVSVQNEVPNTQVDIQKQRMPNGDVELVAIVRDINKKLHNSGQMDRTMSQNYGVRRKGHNYG